MENNESTQKNRRKSRELALQVLYAVEVGELSDAVGLNDHLAREGAHDTYTRNYSRELVQKTLLQKTQLDELIQKYAANWDLKRMAAIDRNILRMALAELQYFPDVPAKVIIDEAVEIAKLYGTDESGKFVNGIIDSIYKNELNDPTQTPGKDG
jgi:N utilization substance protein B